MKKEDKAELIGAGMFCLFVLLLLGMFLMDKHLDNIAAQPKVERLK